MSDVVTIDRKMLVRIRNMIEREAQCLFESNQVGGHWQFEPGTDVARQDWIEMGAELAAIRKALQTP